ncbi:MAG: hypothetical protein U5K99_07525 [Anaerolineales bacterium]|nr:hypothetical protein [Anaerolineales bacterium]
MNIKTRLFIIPSTIIALLLFGPPLFATTKANNSLSAALLLSTGTPVPQNEKDKTIDITQQEEIKAVIEQYFDIHYQALSIPPPPTLKIMGLEI